MFTYFTDDLEPPLFQTDLYLYPTPTTPLSDNFLFPFVILMVRFLFQIPNVSEDGQNRSRQPSRETLLQHRTNTVLRHQTRESLQELGMVGVQEIPLQEEGLPET